MLRVGGRKLGVLAFASRQPGAFTEQHEAIVLALADMVAAALEHERLWNEEHRRRRRGDALECLLPTLAKSMDIREIFKQISEVSQEAIPHDIVGLSFLSADGKKMPVYALSEGRVDHLADPPALPDRMSALQRGFYIMYDITILDREGLALASCGCYAADRNLYDRILGERTGAGLRRLQDAASLSLPTQPG